MIFSYKEPNKGASPWGNIQHSNILAKGLKYVSTAGHGGYMVTERFADKYLSEACKNRGLKYNGYLCYEEDCDYAILEYDLIKNSNFNLFKNEEDEDIKDKHIKSLLKSLSYWNPNYLIEIGETPLEEEYKQYLQRKLRDSMLEAKCPDLIVSALREDDNTVKVYTADDKCYYVTMESYHNNKNSDLNLLSKCELVNK